MSEIRVGLADGYHLGYPKFRWIEQAFQELGHSTVRIRNYQELCSERCDLILFSQNIPVDSDQFSSAPKYCPWVSWIFDLLGHGVGDILLHSTDWSRFDYVFCKNPRELLGAKASHVRWLDQGAPPWPPYDGPRKHDVLIPCRWRESRHRIAQRLTESGIEFVTAGHGWKDMEFPWIGTANTEDQLQLLFHSAKVVVCDNYKKLPWYWSDRVWMALAAGCAFVGPKVQGMEESEAVMLWESEDDIPGLIDEALMVDPEEAYAIAESNSYVDRVAELLQRVDCPVLGSVS